MYYALYVDDDEQLGPIHRRTIVDLHRGIRDGLHLGILGVLADRELLAERGRLDLEGLHVEFRNLDLLITERARVVPLSLTPSLPLTRMKVCETTDSRETLARCLRSDRLGVCLSTRAGNDD